MFVFGKAGAGFGIDLGSGARTVSVAAGAASSSAAQIAGIISGAGSLIKDGPGILTLSVASTSIYNSNTYVGGTTLLSGELDIDNSGGAAPADQTWTWTSNKTSAGTSTFTAASATGLVYGELVSADGLAPGTQITNISGSTITLSNIYTNSDVTTTPTVGFAGYSAIGSGPLTIEGGVIDNTSAADVTLATNNVQYWNADFTYIGSAHNLGMGTGNVTINGNRQVTVAANTFSVGGIGDGGGGFSLTKLGARNVGHQWREQLHRRNEC